MAKKVSFTLMSLSFIFFPNYAIGDVLPIMIKTLDLHVLPNFAFVTIVFASFDL
jgi:hypothetical protein